MKHRKTQHPNTYSLRKVTANKGEKLETCTLRRVACYTISQRREQIIVRMELPSCGTVIILSVACSVQRRPYRIDDLRITGVPQYRECECRSQRKPHEHPSKLRALGTLEKGTVISPTGTGTWCYVNLNENKLWLV